MNSKKAAEKTYTVSIGSTSPVPSHQLPSEHRNSYHQDHCRFYASELQTLSQIEFADLLCAYSQKNAGAHHDRLYPYPVQSPLPAGDLTLFPCTIHNSPDFLFQRLWY